MYCKSSEECQGYETLKLLRWDVSSLLTLAIGTRRNNHYSSFQSAEGEFKVLCNVTSWICSTILSVIQCCTAANMILFGVLCRDTSFKRAEHLTRIRYQATIIGPLLFAWCSYAERRCFQLPTGRITKRLRNWVGCYCLCKNFQNWKYLISPIQKYNSLERMFEAK